MRVQISYVSARIECVSWRASGQWRVLVSSERQAGKVVMDEFGAFMDGASRLDCATTETIAFREGARVVAR
eukprot:3997273-Alexandrium_andersonii.AAC.1